jgi:hypothetical protein
MMVGKRWRRTGIVVQFLKAVLLWAISDEDY